MGSPVTVERKSGRQPFPRAHRTGHSRGSHTRSPSRHTQAHTRHRVRQGKPCVGQRAVPAAHAEAPPHLLSPGRRGALPSPGTPDGRNPRHSQARPPLHLTGDQERRLPVAQSGPGPNRHPCEISRVSLFARSRHCCSYQNQLKLLLRWPRSLSAFMGSGSVPGLAPSQAVGTGCAQTEPTRRGWGTGETECQRVGGGAGRHAQEHGSQVKRRLAAAHALGPNPVVTAREGARQEEGPQPPCCTPHTPAGPGAGLPPLATRPTLTTPAPPRDRPSLGSLSTLCPGYTVGASPHSPPCGGSRLTFPLAS